MYGSPGFTAITLPALGMNYSVKPYSKHEADAFCSAAWCKQLPSALPKVASKDEAQSRKWKGEKEAKMH